MEYSSGRLTDMSRERLIQELEDTREQLKRQKTLKEMFINRGKETTRELEQLRKYSNDITLSNAKIAAQVKDETKRRKKKDILTDYEELKVAYLTNEDKYRADLQEEKDKNTLLQEELDQISVSYNEIRLRYEADVIEVRQQVDTLQDKFTAELHTEQQKNNLLQDKLDRISQEYESEVIPVRQQAEGLQRELEKEVKAHADTVSEDLQMITNLRAEQDDLRHRMTEEINNLQQNTLEKEERYERQLEELKAQLAVQTSVNLELSTELKASKEAEVPEEKPCEQESNATAPAPELLDETEEETHTGKPKKSSWKRVRHFLGLRKPQKWKK
ncbi:centrosomal protein of 112 kDa-like [Sparus aurata]|uniref:centrosomal protein of 112 kDa-like n=1 Tax=Sparus aurata TaxID=8175 RepID=UPI0011C1C169|nr:centrosomal protein of 112 kDa-like [Sparus aurata]